MNIALVIPSLLVGGAEVFIVRLANRLAQRNHRVFLVHLNPTQRSELLEERISPQVTIVPFHYKLSLAQTAWWKLLYMTTLWNATLYREVLFRRNKFKANRLADFLDGFCQQNQIDVINSHLMITDWSVAHYFWRKPRSQKFVISMHGCYNRIEVKTRPFLIRLDQDSPRVLSTADRVVLLTPKNAIPLQGVPLKNDPVYIPLGFEKVADQPDERASKVPLTFTLVSRAIARKGWEEAIAATRQLIGEGIACRLILVGGGEYQEELQEQFGHLAYLHFVGATAQVLPWVQQCDVGLFPSYIESESYPNTVIEYLACGKPVIGTDIGEVKNMMRAPDGTLAGQLLAYHPAGISVAELATCMRRYVENPALLQQQGELARLAFEKFDLDRCVDAYETAYQ
jgi:glycosyltransferase involved in cell wall biosynthesis